MGGQGTHGQGDTIHALIVPADPAFISRRVGGLSVLLRAVCAAARVADTVTVLRTPVCTPAVAAEIDREVRRREALAPVEWADVPGETPDGGSLVLVTGAVIFEPATVAALVAEACSERRTLRRRCRGDARAALWCAPPEHARELLAHLQPVADAARLDRADAADTDSEATLLERVSDEESRRRAEDAVLARARKQSDSAVARFFDRHISAALTRPLLDSPTTPNQVTTANTLVGLAGALLLLVPAHAARLSGALLLVLTVILDGCDGEIARVKYLESNAGRLLDFFTDNVVNAAAILATGLGHYLSGGHGFFYYGSVMAFVLALASVAPVYFLFFREHKAAALSGAAAKGFDPYRLAEGMSGRDFVYLIFFLAIPNRVYWFTPVCLIGLSVFFLFVSALALRRLLANSRTQPARPLLEAAEEQG
jgi:phosphatidylglycerophosphate synthase